MSKNPEKKGGWLTRALNGIERVGNALPHPVTLFAIFALAVVVISAVCAAMGGGGHAAAAGARMNCSQEETKQRMLEILKEQGYL